MVQYAAPLLALLAATATALPAGPVNKRCTGPAINAAGLQLVKDSEGYRSSAYKDRTGHWTIGYGHLCGSASCTDVPYAQPISTSQGESLLRTDLGTAQNCITNVTNSGVRLNANEYAALVDWAFNEGCPNVKSSTLISRLNAGESPQTVLPEELPKWVYSSGQKLDALVTRRNNEIKLAQQATSVGALPACS